MSTGDYYKAMTREEATVYLRNFLNEHEEIKRAYSAANGDMLSSRQKMDELARARPEIWAIFFPPKVSPQMKEGCGCRRCNEIRDDDKPVFEKTNMTRMVVCSKCGNKRCPHATDHEFECTGSNDVGQIGIPSQSQ